LQKPLETIFEGYKVQDIKYIDPPELSESPEPQKTFIFNPAQKSIKIDVYFKDKLCNTFPTSRTI